MASKSWFKIENSTADSTTIYVYDEISSWGVSAKDFVAELNGIKTPSISLRINSPGGDVFDGITIHNALKQHSAKVNVQVDGLAASIASIIAMAGDEVRMAKNSFMMIHNAWTFTAGNADELTKMADTLRKIDGTLVKTYQDKTKNTQRDIKQMMSDETWLSADEALAKGFCDCVGDPAEVKAKFDLSKFAHVPQAVAAMNIQQGNNKTERELEQSLRDSGLSRKQALIAMAAIKDDQRDSDEAVIKSMQNAAAESKLKSLFMQ